MAEAAHHASRIRHNLPRTHTALSDVCEPLARQTVHDACAAPRLRTVMLLLAVWVGDAVWEYCKMAPDATLRSTCRQPAGKPAARDGARIDDGTLAGARSPAVQSMSPLQLPISLRVLTDTLTVLVGVAVPEPCKTRQSRERTIQDQRERGTDGAGRAGLQSPRVRRERQSVLFINRRRQRFRAGCVLASSAAVVVLPNGSAYTPSQCKTAECSETWSS